MYKAIRSDGEYNYEFNVNDLNILKIFSQYKCQDDANAITITALMNNGQDLGARMTVYKRLRRLYDGGYLGKSYLDNHADRYYITKKGENLIEIHLKEKVGLQRKENVINQNVADNIQIAKIIMERMLKECWDGSLTNEEISYSRIYSLQYIAEIAGTSFDYIYDKIVNTKELNNKVFNSIKVKGCPITFCIIEPLINENYIELSGIKITVVE